MAIEIRQLVIKSNVVEGNDENVTGEKAEELGSCELDAIKKRVLEECREWLSDRHSESKER